MLLDPQDPGCSYPKHNRLREGLGAMSVGAGANKTPFWPASGARLLVVVLPRVVTFSGHLFGLSAKNFWRNGADAAQAEYYYGADSNLPE